MRPLSQREYSSSTQKPGFQTTLKSRQGTHARLAELNLSVDVHSMGQTQRSKHNHEVCQAHDDIFAKTATKLSNTNFSHLNQTDEVSKDCLCGRHLGKFHVIKPDLTKNTVYQKSFYQQKAIPNIVNHDKEYEKLKGPHLDMNSTQREGFTGRKGDKIERPHPEDLLHSNGPCPQLSSYTSQFPGYRGDNQYVKPTDSHTRGYFPLRSKSTYAKEFVNKVPEKDDYTYFPDQLKTGSNWFGKTTYGEFFSNPNPEYFAKKVKVIEKKEENPDYNRQYGTIYFIQKLSTKTISSTSPTLSVPPRSTSRLRLKEASGKPKETSPRTQISRPSPLNSMRSPCPNTPTYDQ